MNDLQNDVAREVLHIGMASAAKSLSFFTQETMHLQYFDLALFSGQGALQYFNDTILNKNYVLTTNLVGDFTGKSYLLFSQEEVDIIYQKMFPGPITDPEKAEMMADNLLLELDNIVSAAAVTQFANILKCKLHGDVPILDKVPFGEFLLENLHDQQDVYTMLFTVRFTAGEINLEPSFVWFVDQEFFNQIGKIIDQEEALQALLNASRDIK